MAKKRKIVTPESLEKPGMVVPEYDSRLVNPQLNYVDVGGGVFETRTTTGGGIQSFDVFGATPTSPNIPKPGPTGPGATGPTGPGATGPTGPGATGPGATGPGATGPGATGPGATGPSSEEILAQFYEKIKADATAQRRAVGESSYNLLFEEFSRYGLGALVEPLRSFIEEGISPAEFTIKLRNTDAYKKRFAANAQRIAKGLRALSEAEYIGLEDQYQSIMRQYGLPQSYYTKGDLGRQEGFERFIAGDVSPVELEDRIQTAQSRVTNAPTQIKDALTQFYGAELGNGDVLAFVLDPERALPEIKRKITAAEIGGAATMAGLGTTRTRAEELGRFGITGEAARTGYGTIAGGLERGRQLSGIYQQPEYTQQIAETEVFQLPTAEEARRQRTRLGKLEEATFGGTTGMTGGALARDRAGAF